MKNVYLDWNIFDKLEKLDTLTEPEISQYKIIYDKIVNGELLVPYSNAHINDLLRGYEKNPNYINGHLEIIRRLTNNLCLVQYWGKDHTLWHHREVDEFFTSSLESPDLLSNSLEELLDLGFEFDESDLESQTQSRLAKTAAETLLTMLRTTLLPDDFQQIYSADPIFNVMFPRAKTEMTLLALTNDVLALFKNMSKDYSLYKSFKKFIAATKKQLEGMESLLAQAPTDESGPKYLTFDEAIDKGYSSNTKTSENPVYDLITNQYCKLDLKGYKSDERYQNMFDDSLHVFYGAHCDYFITRDDKCHYKATEVYKQLGIQTMVMKPQEFVEHLKNIAQKETF